MKIGEQPPSCGTAVRLYCAQDLSKKVVSWYTRLETLTIKDVVQDYEESHTFQVVVVIVCTRYAHSDLYSLLWNHT
jgi:hypothetical protein